MNVLKSTSSCYVQNMIENMILTSYLDKLYFVASIQMRSRDKLKHQVRGQFFVARQIYYVARHNFHVPSVVTLFYWLWDVLIRLYYMHSVNITTALSENTQRHQLSPWYQDYLLTNWLAYLYGRIQSPRPDVMPDRREGITRAAGFVFACIDTQAS